ncbi:hypothetical protein BOSE62_150008 [Bosea sp. 62]|nr:hypothetical protein BOSE21B_11059 [Bosea sp. 21B]CAD5261236.1 hypothetical protein BOSE7B_150076 [Bosea sp. 7B]CAD5273456.1 hypothetical protein BOSE46_20289 [Bosea sp. 46]VVT43417.1 hypothetical protein BOS5A_10009 [Bosea sp. EC-HK365B]VXB27443.1 hypothetical protein BOSE29B_10825 [Bosea sp. 29B]VXB64411.1 hypothetical protein BOSE62_150008 [Bosea sp. 62]VXC30214.1 hypothetical protein BOSE127_180078 [Bosea sp. 127]VXC59918.1 hypothetical protein BOSE125_30288 [Bosea sp. 125]
MVFLAGTLAWSNIYCNVPLTRSRQGRFGCAVLPRTTWSQCR